MGARYEGAGHRRQHDGRERGKRVMADDDLEREEHAGERRVERRGDRRRHAAADEINGERTPEPELLGDARRQRGAEMHHRPFRPTEAPTPSDAALASAAASPARMPSRPARSATASITSATPCVRPPGSAYRMKSPIASPPSDGTSTTRHHGNVATCAAREGSSTLPNAKPWIRR